MEDAGIYTRESPYLDLFVQIGAAGEKVIARSFPVTPDEDAADDHPVLDRIEAYLQGGEDSFADAEIGLTVRTDYRNVLEAVREIPYGEQGSVQQVVTDGRRPRRERGRRPDDGPRGAGGEPDSAAHPRPPGPGRPERCTPGSRTEAAGPRRTLIMSVGTICRRQTLTAVNRS